MISNKFDLSNFLAGSPFEQEALAAKLSELIVLRTTTQFEPIFERIVEDLRGLGHVLSPEFPWSPGEFAFSDPSLGEQGLRIAFDVVVSIGFADRSPDEPYGFKG